MHSAEWNLCNEELTLCDEVEDDESEDDGNQETKSEMPRECQLFKAPPVPTSNGLGSRVPGLYSVCTEYMYVHVQCGTGSVHAHSLEQINRLPWTCWWRAHHLIALSSHYRRVGSTKCSIADHCFSLWVYYWHMLLHLCRTYWCSTWRCFIVESLFVLCSESRGSIESHWYSTIR